MPDCIATKSLEVFVQQNGIIRRDSDGRLIGRLVSDFDYKDLEDDVSPEFQKDLKDLINRHSIENLADMPDFIMARMIAGVLHSIGKAVKRNTKWHDPDNDKEV